ncbi:uncharacterized protein LOC141680953 [Apium graveolens]|uniref:uncharacterized protein LOC141680953 n=1 Tax=Apium graveolens TaxID=4045 RepID=UPI003D7B4DBA
MRFGIPVVLVSDNKPQFVGSDFEAYLKELGIKHKRSSMAHPQGNGQVEVTNRTILRDLEKRLEHFKKTWPYELPKVLWSYRTTPRIRIEETPFKLAFGFEVRLPVETGSPSHRVTNLEEISNIEGLKTNLELLDEVRDQAVQMMKKYKEKTKALLWKESQNKGTRGWRPCSPRHRGFRFNKSRQVTTKLGRSLQSQRGITPGNLQAKLPN